MPPARKNKYKAVIDKHKFEQLMMSAGYYTFSDFYEPWICRYGFNLGYKGFIRLLSNKYNWMGTYMLSVAQFLNVSVEDIFVLQEQEH